MEIDWLLVVQDAFTTWNVIIIVCNVFNLIALVFFSENLGLGKFWRFMTVLGLICTVITMYGKLDSSYRKHVNAIKASEQNLGI